MKIKIEDNENATIESLEFLNDYPLLLKIIEIGGYFKMEECTIHSWKGDQVLQRVYMENNTTVMTYSDREKRLSVRLKSGYHSTNGYREAYRMKKDNNTHITLSLDKSFDKIVKDIQNRFFNKLQEEINYLQGFINEIQGEELKEIELKKELESLGLNPSCNFNNRFYLNGSNNYLSLEYGKVKLTNDRLHLYYKFNDAKTAIKASDILVSALKNIEAMEAK